VLKERIYPTPKPFDVPCGNFLILEDLDRNESPIIYLAKFGNNPKHYEERS